MADYCRGFELILLPQARLWLLMDIRPGRISLRQTTLTLWAIWQTARPRVCGCICSILLR